MLINALNFAYDTGTLSITKRRGIIKLIPKKDSEPHLIKKWRPLSLLNCDYKIAAKAIANRIKSVISKLINNDQTGFIKGRFVEENIRLVDNIINYASENNIPAPVFYCLSILKKLLTLLSGPLSSVRSNTLSLAPL